MLRFQTSIDKVFTDILTLSIEAMIDELRDLLEYAENKKEEQEDLKWLLPNASKVFNAKTALNTLRKLLSCHKRPKLYYLNDYHYLLLFDTIQDFCISHDDFVKEAKTKKEKRERSMIGSFHIEKLDFDEIIDTYFYDTDFLIDADTMIALTMEERKSLGLNKEAFSISQGLAPHPEELALKVYKSES